MGSIPSLAQWVEGSDIATAVAWIQSLALEFPYAMGAAIKKKMKKNIYVQLNITLLYSRN